MGPGIRNHKRGTPPVHREKSHPLHVLETVINDLGDGLIAVDARQRCLFINQEARRILGLGPKESIPERIPDHFSFYLPDEVTLLPATDNPLIRALRGEHDNLELIIRGIRGASDTWVNCTLSPVTDERGRVAFGVVVLRDVTETKHSRTELAESNRRLKQAQRMAHFGSWERDLITDHVIWSEELYRLYGLQPGGEAPTGAKFLACIHPDDREAIKLKIAGAKRGEIPTHLEYRTIHPDGTIHYLFAQAKVTFNASGRPLRLFGVVQDHTEQKLAEAALAEQTSKLRTVIENVSDAIFIKDMEGRYLLINPAGAAAMGTTVENALGKRDENVFSPSTAARLQHSDRKVMKTRRPLVVEELVETGRGDKRIYLSVKAPYLSAQGKLLGMLGISRDMTEYKQAQEQLSRNREQLAEAQHVAKMGSWELNLSTGQLVWSEETYRLLGVSPNEFKPSLSAFYELVHPEDRGSIEAAMAKLSKSGPEQEYDYRIIRSDGNVRYIHGRGRVVQYSEGRPLKIIGTTQDITEKKQREEALMRSYAMLQAQREASLDGILVIDEHKRVVDYNHRFLSIWGVTQRCIGTTDHEALTCILPALKAPTEFLDRVDYLYAHPAESGHDEISLNDGRTLDRYTAPIMSPDGRPYGRVWSFRDVTERKRLEEQLRNQYQTLQELDRVKSHFVNAVTHELRTPLTSVMGYAEFLEDGIGGELTDQQLGYVRQLLEGAKRLDAILSDLLDYARLETGTFKLVLQPADLNQKVQEILESLMPQASVANITLETHTAEAPLQLQMDAQRIGQVLLNLIGNAIKFTPPGGTVCVRTVDEGQVVRCLVKDTGPGINPEDLAKLFDRFIQLEAGRKKGVGMGLGLNIAKSIVEAHGGHIGVESVPGEGSTFWFTLPRTQPGAESEE